MTDGFTVSVAKYLRRRLFTLHGAVLLVGIVALIVGVVSGSAAGRIVCAAILAAAAAFLVVSFRSNRLERDENDQPEESVQPTEDTMKTLLFDDFQAPTGGYVVKEFDEEAQVLPSSKSARTVSAGLKPETLRQLEILDFFDLDSDEVPSESEPKSEFHSLVDKVLLVLKDVLFAHTVAFFWANREKSEMVLESMATDSKHFMEGRRYPIDRDLVSQVASDGKPQIVGRITASTEQELLRYYDAPDPVQSVLCVPVYFKNGSADLRPVGVIVADSTAEDAFGQETLVLMGRFTKLVSALLKSYTDKYELLLDSELLSSIRRMQDRAKSDPVEAAILDALCDEAHRLANWEYLTITMYAEEKHGWVVQRVVNKTGEAYVRPDQPVEMGGSLAGEVVRNNEVKVIDDLGACTKARFHPEEAKASAGSFACIPISSFNRCYGALSLESRSAAHFTGSEVETLYRLVEQAATMLEVVYLNASVKDHVIVDHLTGSLTRKHFLRKVEEEVRRAEDFGTELTCISIVVDAMQDHATRYGKEGVEAILAEIAGIARANLRAYDVFGRQGEERFGVLLVQTAASDGYLWAEKIRKMIASHVVTADGKSFSVTMSAGVCGLTDGMQPAELLAGTEQVLGKAVERGGNLVRVY